MNTIVSRASALAICTLHLSLNAPEECRTSEDAKVNHDEVWRARYILMSEIKSSADQKERIRLRKEHGSYIFFSSTVMQKLHQRYNCSISNSHLPFTRGNSKPSLALPHQAFKRNEQGTCNDLWRRDDAHGICIGCFISCIVARKRGSLIVDEIDPTNHEGGIVLKWRNEFAS